MSNLIDIYALFTNLTTSDIEKRYAGKTYAVFKKDLADVLVEKIVPIGNKIKTIEQDKAEVLKILKRGADKLAPLAQQTMRDVRAKIGLV
jgi:tryptophanyl-tRNA synthetase